jgi:hypothetical protein
MMSDSLINDPRLARAVSNITARSERQPNAEVLRETYVETGVLPQVANFGNQILYGREVLERPTSSKCWALTRRTRPTPS